MLGCLYFFIYLDKIIEDFNIVYLLVISHNLKIIIVASLNFFAVICKCKMFLCVVFVVNVLVFVLQLFEETQLGRFISDSQGNRVL